MFVVTQLQLLHSMCVAGVSCAGSWAGWCADRLTPDAPIRLDSSSYRVQPGIIKSDIDDANLTLLVINPLNVSMHP